MKLIKMLLFLTRMRASPFDRVVSNLTAQVDKLRDLEQGLLFEETQLSADIGNDGIARAYYDAELSNLRERRAKIDTLATGLTRLIIEAKEEGTK